MNLRKDKPITESFYNKLNQLYQRIQTHNTKITVSDCNAEIRRQAVFKPVVGNWSLYETSNKMESEQMILPLIEEGRGLSNTSSNSGYPHLSDTGAAILQIACELSSSTTENLL
jgi:hypothetical protein